MESLEFVFMAFMALGALMIIAGFVILIVERFF